MKILSVHNSYQVRGGEDESWAAEVRLLRDRGHQVYVYEENNDSITRINPAVLAKRTIWSHESYNKVLDILRSNSCDIVHVQNFFPLISPSIYYAAQSLGVPVIQTLRNYRLLCPNALFFRDGRVCEDCLGKFIPFPGIVHNCYRQSRVATTVTAGMLVAHRGIGTWHKQVNFYIALTEFARKKFIAGGIEPHKIVVKPNFVQPDPGVGEGDGGFALYVGRLSVEKGLDTLLDAWKLLQDKIPLKIVGDGPLADQVQAVAAKLDSVEWLGRRPMPEVHELMGQAKILVFPSKWYETFGRVAVEAFAKGTPVVASDIGAIAELVVDGRTGIRFCPGSASDLADKVNWILADPAKLSQMRRTARTEFETYYTADSNYKQLIQIYKQACS